MNLRAWLASAGMGELAPELEALDFSLKEVTQLGMDDLAKLGVDSILDRKRMMKAIAELPAKLRAMAAESTSELGARVLEDFPFPIAYGYRQTLEAENAAVGVQNLLYTYTSALRFATLVLLSQYLTGENQNPSVSRAVRRLQLPSLDDWYQVLGTLERKLFPRPGGAGLASYPPFAEGGPFSPALLEGIRRMKNLRVSDQSLHEVVLRFRNDFAGHGATWKEHECRAQLEGMRPHLEAVLDALGCLGELTLVRGVGDGRMIRLVGSERTFESEPIVDPDLEALLDEVPVVLMAEGGERMPLYPIFTGPEHEHERQPEGYADPLFAFDGHVASQGVVYYMGVDRRLRRQDTVARYAELLQSKDIDPRFRKTELRPWLLAEWAQETSAAEVQLLTGTKYIPAAYEERLAHGGATGVDDAVTRWLDHGDQAALVLAAEAGAGKTSLLCRLTERLLPGAVAGDALAAGARVHGQDCVLLLLGGAIRGTSDRRLFRRIRQGLGFTNEPKLTVGSLTELLTAWRQTGARDDVYHEDRRLILLVDAVNEAEDPRALLDEIAGLAREATAANRAEGRVFVRLLVSVRAVRLETTLRRWADQQDTPLLPRNHFAHFTDARGGSVPYLELRRFTEPEAESAWQRAQAAREEPCSATWESLSPATRALLAHPLMLQLFQDAFAGEPMPPALAAEDALWSAWLERTFAQSSGRIEGLALDLADACMEAGAATVPVEIAADWKQRWEVEEMGGEPLRIAAGIDPIERLADHAILRRTADADWDWTSDALAEQILWRALRRRDPKLNADSLQSWLALPATPRLDGALALVGLDLWRQARARELVPFLGLPRSRARAILADVVTSAAPRGPEASLGPELKAFAAGLDSLVCPALEEASIPTLDLLRDALLDDADSQLAERWGTTAARGHLLAAARKIAERLVQLQPANTGSLLSLSVSYCKMGEQDLCQDPTGGTTWFAKALEIAQLLVEQEPENRAFLRRLSASYYSMGFSDPCQPLPRMQTWFEKALQIRERLVQQEPENTSFLSDASESYCTMGELALRQDDPRALTWFDKALELNERLLEQDPENIVFLLMISNSYGRMGHFDSDPARARAWYSKTLEIQERLREQEPDNTVFLHNLSVSYGKMANLDEDPTRADTWIDKALKIQERLVEQEP